MIQAADNVLGLKKMDNRQGLGPFTNYFNGPSHDISHTEDSTYALVVASVARSSLSLPSPPPKLSTMPLLVLSLRLHEFVMPSRIGHCLM